MAEGAGGVDHETRVTQETYGEEQTEADAPHRADRPPTAEEERLAEAGREKVDPSVARHHQEMDRLGAEQKGEGRIG